MYYKKKVVKFLLVLGLLVVFMAAYSLAAANTVPANSLGEGAGVISGYTVSDLEYVLNGSNPSNIDQVDFSLDGAATTVKTKLVAAGSSYYSCNLNVTTWECATTSPQATVALSDELRVIAVE